MLIALGQLLITSTAVAAFLFSRPRALVLETSTFQQNNLVLLLSLCRISTTMFNKSDTVSFSAKGQLVIPRWLRNQFGIEEGTKASVIATPEGILLKPITRAYIRSLRGHSRARV